MPLVHISDLHIGSRASLDALDALRTLVATLRPELVVATGDLTHRGRPEELATAREVLSSLDAPMLAVPGNHDIPHSAVRFVRPWSAYESMLGPTTPVYRSDTLVVAGLCSARPWRHQSGQLDDGALARARAELSDAETDALRVVALHHHLANAPWRARRKRPLRRRDRAVALLSAAGADLALGGHIHQSSAVQVQEVTLDPAHSGGGLVLTTAPGLDRPRPHRTGEAQGIHVVDWDDATLTVTVRIWNGEELAPVAVRTFPRSRLSP